MVRQWTRLSAAGRHGVETRERRATSTTVYHKMTDSYNVGGHKVLNPNVQYTQATHVEPAGIHHPFSFSDTHEGASLSVLPNGQIFAHWRVSFVSNPFPLAVNNRLGLLCSISSVTFPLAYQELSSPPLTKFVAKLLSMNRSTVDLFIDNFATNFLAIRQVIYSILS